MKSSHFNKHERAVVSALFKERRPLSIKEISEKAQMSWTTTKKYVKKLNQRDIVTTKTETTNGHQRFTFNYVLLDEGETI